MSQGIKLGGGMRDIRIVMGTRKTGKAGILRGDGREAWQKVGSGNGRRW